MVSLEREESEKESQPSLVILSLVSFPHLRRYFLCISPHFVWHPLRSFYSSHFDRSFSRGDLELERERCSEGGERKSDANQLFKERNLLSALCCSAFETAILTVGLGN